MRIEDDPSCASALAAYGAEVEAFLRATDGACVGVPLSRVGRAVPLPAALKSRVRLGSALAALPQLRLFAEQAGAGECTYAALRARPPYRQRAAPVLTVTIENELAWPQPEAPLRGGEAGQRWRERYPQRLRRRRTPSPRSGRQGTKRPFADAWDDRREEERRAGARGAQGSVPRGSAVEAERQQQRTQPVEEGTAKRRRWDAPPAAAPLPLPAWAASPFAAGARPQGPDELLPQCGVARAQQRRRWTVDYDAERSVMRANADALGGAELYLRLTRYETRPGRGDHAEVAFAGQLAPWRCVVTMSHGADAVLQAQPTASADAFAAAFAPPLHAPRCAPAAALVGRRPASVTVVFSRDVLTELVAAEVAAHVASNANGTPFAVGFCTRHLQATAVALPPPAAPPIAAPLAHSGLNEEQAACVADVAAGAALTLALGPPGTGKTRTIGTVAAVLAAAGEGVLVTAAANVAALNALKALLAAGVAGARLMVSMSYYVYWHEHEFDAALWPFMDVADWRPEWRSVTEPPAGVPPEELPTQPLLPPPPPLPGQSTAPLVRVCTFGMLRRAVGDDDVARSVTALLVDEASQAWAALSYAFDKMLPCLRRLHLFGDNNQLPPSLASRFGGAAGALHGVRSLYDAAEAAGHVRHALRTQYRMPRQLAEFVSRMMYGSQLRTPPQRTADLHALRWVDVPDGRAVHPTGGLATSWVNEAEVTAVIAEMDAVDATAAAGASRVVLTPYTAQRAALEAAAAHRATAGGGRWEVKTVDAFQGREASHVILSLVRANAQSGAGFLADARRANVALSRAAATLAVVGRHAAWAAMRDAPLMRQLAERLRPEPVAAAAM